MNSFTEVLLNNADRMSENLKKMPEARGWTPSSEDSGDVGLPIVNELGVGDGSKIIPQKKTNLTGEQNRQIYAGYDKRIKEAKSIAAARRQTQEVGEGLAAVEPPPVAEKAVLSEEQTPSVFGTIKKLFSKWWP